MHPAVENAYPHEPAVAVRPGRGERDLVPDRFAHVLERGAPRRKNGLQLLAHLVGAVRTHRLNPGLVHRTDLVADVPEGGDVDVDVRCGQPLQERLGSDDVGDHVLHGPPRQRRRCFPLTVRQVGKQLLEVFPDGEETREHLGFGQDGDGAICAVHGPKLSPPHARSPANRLRCRSARPAIARRTG